MATREKGGSTRAMLVVLAGLTAAHGAYRWLFGGPPEPEAVVVSELPMGTVVPTFQVDVAKQGGWAPGPLLERPACQLVIAFDPACPYCYRAAETESSVDPGRRLPTTWVTDGDVQGTLKYRDRLDAATRVVRSDAVIRALEVKGVPAAFLVDAHGAVRRAWAYKGTESRAELEPACDAEEDVSAPAASAAGPREPSLPIGR